MMNTIQNMYTYCTSFFFSFRFKTMAMEMELVQPEKNEEKGERGKCKHEKKKKVGKKEERVRYGVCRNDILQSPFHSDLVSSLMLIPFV